MAYKIPKDIHIEFYDISKKMFGFAMASYLAYLISLMSLEFRLIESASLAESEVMYYEKVKPENSEKELWMAKQKLKIAQSSLKTLNETVESIRNISYQIAIVSGAFFFLSVFMWFVYIGRQKDN